MTLTNTEVTTLEILHNIYTLVGSRPVRMTTIIDLSIYHTTLTNPAMRSLRKMGYAEYATQEYAGGEKITGYRITETGIDMWKRYHVL